MKLISALSLAVAGALAVLPESGSAAENRSQVQPRSFARLIVKFKAGEESRGLSAQQMQAESRRPLASQRLKEISSTVGREVRYGRPVATGGHLVLVPGVRTPQDLQAAIKALRARTDVEYVEEDRRMFRKGGLPNDPRWADLWSFKTPEPWAWGTVGADFLGAWNLSTGKNVTVAVVDTGILPHPDIVGPGGSVSPATGALASPGYTFITDCWTKGTCSFEQGWYSDDWYVAPSEGAMDHGDYVTEEESYALEEDFWYSCSADDSSWHGTHVAGTVAALGKNSIGVIGGAYGARLLPVRVLGKCGGWGSDVAEGILWAAGVHPDIPNPHPAQVINMSLGGEGDCDYTYRTAINAAVKAGAVVVVAAGNSNNLAQGDSPGNCPNVIAVAATGKYGEKAYYSNYDAADKPPVIALAAPGGSHIPGDEEGTQILSTLNSGKTSHDPDGWTYQAYQGTSMAAPHVSAAVALMRSRNPNMSPLQVTAVLTAQASVTPFPKALSGVATCSTSTCGSGILNAERAVRNSVGVLASSPEVVDFGTGNLSKSAAQTVRFTNTNPVLPMSLGKVMIGGAAADAYVKTADACTDTVLPPGQSCSVEVSMPRNAVGDFAANLELGILPSAGGEAGAMVVALKGSSSAVVQSAGDTLEVPAPQAGKSVVMKVVFKNVGVEAALMEALLLSSPDIMAVSSDACSNVTLAPGASCSADITVTPLAAGNFVGTVSLKSTAVDDPGAQVSISGVAREAPATAAGGGGGGGGCTALPLGQGQGDFSLLAYLVAVLAFGWTRRRRQALR